MSGSDDERQEKEERAEAAARLAKTGTRMDLIPATIQVDFVIRERVEILNQYDEETFRRIYR